MHSNKFWEFLNPELSPFAASSITCKAADCFFLVISAMILWQAASVPDVAYFLAFLNFPDPLPYLICLVNGTRRADIAATFLSSKTSQLFSSVA